MGQGKGSSSSGNGGGGSGRGGSTPERSPNDDRSDVKNSNNPAHEADQENRRNQASQ